MIVLTEDTPNEHTPLKSPSGPPPHSPPTSSPPPPPYYSPTSPVAPSTGPAWPRHHHPGQPAPTTPIPFNTARPQGVGSLIDNPDRVARGRALRRLFRAWLVAWVVIFLWGMFVGSVRVTISNFERDSPSGILQTWWEHGSLIDISVSSRPGPGEGKCTCSGDGSPTSTQMPFIPAPTATWRPLPLGYPPLSKFSASVQREVEGQNKLQETPAPS